MVKLLDHYMYSLKNATACFKLALRSKHCLIHDCVAKLYIY